MLRRSAAVIGLTATAVTAVTTPSAGADPSDYQHVRTGQIANAMPPLVDHLMRYMSAAYAAPRM